MKIEVQRRAWPPFRGRRVTASRCRRSGFRRHGDPSPASISQSLNKSKMLDDSVSAKYVPSGAFGGACKATSGHQRHQTPGHSVSSRLHLTRGAQFRALCSWRKHFPFLSWVLWFRFIYLLHASWHCRLDRGISETNNKAIRVSVMNRRRLSSSPATQ